MTPFEQLQANSPYRAIFRNRNPDPGECAVSAIDWETQRLVAHTAECRYFPAIEEVFLWRKPDPTDPLEKLRDFLLPDDINLATPMELVTELYRRIRLARDIAQIENSSSWDYCKVAAVDWLNKTPRWIPIHHADYWYQMGCVPPYFQRHGVTMTGEAYRGAWHLSLLERGDTYWCCMLTKGQVTEPEVVAGIPFADIPTLGIPTGPDTPEAE